MSKILVTGDIHGTYDIGPIQNYFAGREDEYTKDDYLIICGDVCVCGFSARESRETREFLSNLPVTVLFVDGNHENHPMLGEYPVDEWNGGKVHMISDDIIHLMRGQVFDIDGRTFFTFGGAYSIDRDERIEGVSWFREELPSEQEYREGWKNLERVGFAVDYIITHTAPSEVAAYLGFGDYEEAMRQQDIFQEYIDETEFGHMFFGHYHIDEDVEDVFHCLMDRVVDLDDFATFYSQE